MKHSYWNALGASDIWCGAADMEVVATAHERNNKLGLAGPPTQAVDTTMDLFNNSVGRGVVHTTSTGVPDASAIQSDLSTLYDSGGLCIWDGGPASQSQGILLKSNGAKMY